MAKRNKIEVKTIEIDIAGEKLRLSPAQARELRDILMETFPKNQPAPYIPPIIIERDRYVKPYQEPWHPSYPWITWCGGFDSTSGMLTLTSDTSTIEVT